MSKREITLETKADIEDLAALVTEAANDPRLAVTLITRTLFNIASCQGLGANVAVMPERLAPGAALLFINADEEVTGFSFDDEGERFLHAFHADPEPVLGALYKALKRANKDAGVPALLKRMQA